MRHRYAAGGLPGLNAWSMFAGGTSAAPDKHGYGFSSASRRYSISPHSTRHGRHAGYLLTVFPSEHGGTAWISPDGREHYVPTHESSYRSPQAAVKAARAHAAQDWPATGVCPSCGARAISAGECKACGWSTR